MNTKHYFTLRKRAAKTSHTKCLEVFMKIKLCLDHMSVWLKKFGVEHKDPVNNTRVGWPSTAQNLEIPQVCVLVARVRQMNPELKIICTSARRCTQSLFHRDSHMIICWHNGEKLLSESRHGDYTDLALANVFCSLKWKLILYEDYFTTWRASR